MEKGKILRWTVGFVLMGLLLVAGPILGVFQSVVKAQEFAGEIVIGDDEELTGAYASTTYALALAVQDYWRAQDYRIRAGGKTYKIKHLLVDNKSEVALSVANFNRFVAEGAVVVRTDWTSGMVAMKPLAEKARIPVLGGGFNKDAFVPLGNYVYGMYPSYPGTICATFKWFKNNIWKGPGKMKVGLLLWDNSYGRSSHLESVYDYLKNDLGVEVLPTQFFPTRVHDLTPQLSRFKEQGVNLIWFQALAAQYAILARDAKRLGIPPTSLISSYFCLSDKYVELAKDAAEGTYGVWQWYVDPSEDNPKYPAVQKVHDAMEKYRGNRYFDLNYFSGWSYMVIIHHYLIETIKKYGFPITGEQVADCFSTGPAWDWGLTRSFSGYRSGDRLGYHETRVHQVKNGKVVLSSDWTPAPIEFLKREPWIAPALIR